MDGHADLGDFATYGQVRGRYPARSVLSTYQHQLPRYLRLPEQMDQRRVWRFPAGPAQQHVAPYRNRNELYFHNELRLLRSRRLQSTAKSHAQFGAALRD